MVSESTFVLIIKIIVIEFLFMRIRLNDLYYNSIIRTRIAVYFDFDPRVFGAQ